MINKKSKRRKYKTVNKRKKNTKTKAKKKKNTSTKKRKIVKGGMEEKERDNECAICFEELNNEDQENPFITLGCNHTFHRNCIINTCRHQRGPCLCPLCRGVLTPEELNELGIALPLQPQLPRAPSNLETVEEFKNYINDKLRAPTRMPLEKLENELYEFLGTDNLPVELYEENTVMDHRLPIERKAEA